MSGETVQGLRRDAVGLREVLFQSVTAMAPAAAVAASIPSGAAFAGGSLPLSVLIALVACLFTASCVAELARELPAAGSVATYAAQGLHPAVGFLVGWGYVFVEALVPPLLLLQLGFTTEGTLHQEWPSYPENLWWPWALAGAAIIAVAGWFGVRASARFGTVLGVFEILVFLVFAIWLIGKAGSDNTLSVFGTSHTGKDYSGLGGVFAGSVYTVLAFAGFEAAAPLAEETRDPRRTMHRAVLGAALGIGLFYVLTTYAMTVYFGPDRFSGFGASGAASWEGWPARRSDCSGCWCSSPWSTRRSPTPTRAPPSRPAPPSPWPASGYSPVSWPHCIHATAPPSPESPCRPSSRWEPCWVWASATTR